ncbi:MAG TPA: nucleotide exchange factor GrpE [Bacteroidota bacterium]|nr:nucleotide exchange factor GrpE [Bacteroidota bacterium]
MKEEEKVTNGENGKPGESSSPDSLQAHLDELKKSLDQTKDQLLRRAAEFENYKKRIENDTADRIRYANENLLEDLLPVLDDFERSMKMSKDRKDFAALYSGVELIYQKLLKVLELQGLKSYESLGKPFDTAHHDALMQMPKQGVPPHTVIEEVEKGYALNDRVLRHAKVVVASEDPEHPSENEGSASDGSAHSS